MRARRRSWIAGGVLLIGIVARLSGACGMPAQTPDAAGVIDGGIDARDVVIPTDGALQPLLSPWVEIQPGTFRMGSKPEAWGRGRFDEDEVEVTLTHRFEVGRYEVTQREWTRFGLPNSSSTDPKSIEHGDEIGDRYPVGTVTWYEALAYANLRSERAATPKPPCFTLTKCTGQLGQGLVCESVSVNAPTLYECEGYRLPTEAEWEYAARAGTTTDFYAGNFGAPDGPISAPDPTLDRIAWYVYNTDLRSRPVGAKEPNAWGLFDVAGNAREWVFDWYGSRGYGVGPLVDPLGVPTGKYRVLRGGCAWCDTIEQRSAARFYYNASVRVPLNGLRLVRTLRPGEAVDTE